MPVTRKGKKTLQLHITDSVYSLKEIMSTTWTTRLKSILPELGRDNST
jgi:hypothetical protein